MKRLTYLLLVGIVLLSLGSGNAFGQATASGTIQGTVTDQSGAVVTGAQVVAKNKATDVSRTATSSDTGDYRFELLPVGNYTVTVSKTGFATYAQTIEILIGQAATVNAELKPGAASELIEVTSEAPVLDQAKTDVSQNITPREVQELPMVGRDVANLAYLAPGVKPADSYDPTKNRYSILSVNGQGGRNVNVTVNGVDNKDNTVGGPVMQLPAEAVQEFQISTQRFSAVNGRSEGAAINVITKSGTNGYHGAAFGFFRDQALNAAQKVPDPWNTTNPFSYVTPTYSRQWFGGSIGGPIKKDKLFAFFAIERQREPTPAIVEEPTALTQLNLVTSLGAKPSATIPTPFYENRIAGRMDWNISSKHTAYLSIATQANNSLNEQSNSTYDLTEGNFTKNHMQIANLTLNSTFSSTLLNTFTAGWQYWNNLIDSTTRAPLITFPVGAEFGTKTNVPQESIQRKWQLKDELSKTVGRHTFKTGFDYIFTPFMGGFFEFNPTLEIDFGVNPSCILGVGPDATTAGCGPSAYPNGFSTPGLISGNNIGPGMT